MRSLTAPCPVRGRRYRRFGLVACLLVYATVDGQTTVPAPARGHPAVGVWRAEYRDGCVETYYLHGDGSLVHTSGEAVSRGVFSVSATPGLNGAYALVERPQKSNGRPDCAGAVISAGQPLSLFVFFDTSRQQMLGCYDAAGRRCFGPLLRMDGPPT
jgi:hypothetical protein